MLYVLFFYWIFFLITQTLCNTKSNAWPNVSITEQILSANSSPVRREWPEINFRFEDYYQNSGDGPSEANDTENYIWTTIVTQIRASIWPTVTRIKLTTPLPRSTHIALTPVITENSYYLFSESYGNIFSPSLELISSNILTRSSLSYLGPSSTLSVITSPKPIDISSPNDFWLSSYYSKVSTLSSELDYSKSAFSADTLSKFNSSGNIPVQNSQTSIEIFSISSESLHTTPSSESLSVLFSIYDLSKQIEESLYSPIVSTSDVTVPQIIHLSSSQSQSLDTSDLTSSSTTRTPYIATTNTFDALSSTGLLMSPLIVTSSVTLSQSFKPALTPTPTLKPDPTASTVPLCRENPHNEHIRHPNASEFDKPLEDYLIRTVLRNSNNESYDDIKKRVEGNIKQIYMYAYGKQYEEIKVNTNTRKLLQLKVKPINASIDAKIWEISAENASQQIHVIYSVRRNGTLIPYEDALRTLSHISDQTYSKMIGMDVIAKIKPYAERKEMQQIMARSKLNLWGIILIACLGLLLIICIVTVTVILGKYREVKRKWNDSFHMELNRVKPDSGAHTHWRTVSRHSERISDPTPTAAKRVIDRSEFQYVPFQSDRERDNAAANIDTREQSDTNKKKKTASKAVQSCGIEMQKEKVVAIGKIIDNNDDPLDMIELATTATTFVTTRDIDTSDNSAIPRIIEVRMSEQTQSIIRAIRNELRKFGSDGSSASSLVGSPQRFDGSIISNVSNSSEA